LITRHLQPNDHRIEMIGARSQGGVGGLTARAYLVRRSPRIVKRSFYRVVIVMVLVGQLAWFIMPRSGSHPLSQRAIKAAQTAAEHPSAATKAAFEEELRRIPCRDNALLLTVFTVMLVLDGIGIYYFWNYGYRRHTA
jgi:hypothetical protein